MTWGIYVERNRKQAEYGLQKAMEICEDIRQALEMKVGLIPACMNLKKLAKIKGKRAVATAPFKENLNVLQVSYPI